MEMNFQKSKKIDQTQPLAALPKIWSWKWVFTKYGRLIYRWKAYGNEIQKFKNEVKKSLNNLSHFLLRTKISGNPVETRSQEDQKTATHPTQFLQQLKIGLGSKMAQNDLEPINVSNYNF